MIGWGLGLNIAAANVPVSLCFSGLTALGRAGCPQPAVDQIENRISHEVRSPIRERTARRAVPTSEGGAFEGTRGHGDMGARGVNEDLRTRGPEGAIKVGLVVRNPPLSGVRIGSLTRCVALSTNGQLGEPSLPKAKNSKGNRRPDDWLGISHLPSVIRDRFSPQLSPPFSPPFSPLSSTQSSVINSALVSGGGWQPRVAGGGKSGLRHLPSIQPSPELFPSSRVS